MKVGIVLIHGTFARESDFASEANPIAALLQKRLSNELDFRYWKWTGNNSHLDRISSGEQLANAIFDWSSEHRWKKVIVVGHSHGGTIAFQAVNLLENLERLKRRCGPPVCLVTFGTPFFRFKPRKHRVPLGRCAFGALFYWTLGWYWPASDFFYPNFVWLEFLAFAFLGILFSYLLLLVGDPSSAEELAFCKSHVLATDSEVRSKYLQKHVAVTAWTDEAYHGIKILYLLFCISPVILFTFLLLYFAPLFPASRLLLDSQVKSIFKERFFTIAVSVTYFSLMVSAARIVERGVLSRLRSLGFGATHHLIEKHFGVSVHRLPRTWDASDLVIRFRGIPNLDLATKRLELAHSEMCMNNDVVEKIVSVCVHFVRSK
jgi:pimeloyl-ACP methyl ester carboxylesterase